MTDYWFSREECSDFYAQLCADVNEASSNEWQISNYHNDACGSVCFYLDNDTETYVQLFAFMTQEDADDEELSRFAITVSCNGETDWETQWIGDSRDEACQQAALAAVKLRERYEAVLKEEAEEEDDEIEIGFEHEGMWITDRTKSPCGRFDLTEEESLKTYGHPKTQPAQEPATVPNFYEALADELNARTNQIDADWYALPPHHGHTDVSYDFSVSENDDGFPTRVLLKTWLFDDEPEFEVRVVVNGEHDTAYKGKDRNTAIAFAIAKAVQIDAEWVPVIA